MVSPIAEYGSNPSRVPLSPLFPPLVVWGAPPHIVLVSHSHGYTAEIIDMVEDVTRPVEDKEDSIKGRREERNS
jgi:hypothetical protein